MGDCFDLFWSFPWVSHALNMSENYRSYWIETDFLLCIMQTSPDIIVKTYTYIPSLKGLAHYSRSNWRVFLRWEDDHGKCLTHAEFADVLNRNVFLPELKDFCTVNGAGNTWFYNVILVFVLKWPKSCRNLSDDENFKVSTGCS